ncbi:zf-CCCH domain-containing protein [Cephalotus follicularis]|uniref:Zf-CCCH domain-containing protein n=1 Tax=Cephalotus follicularis TaxID=3775 RepID=A0A1Q3DCE1_CEPFO|nr:zf-CCCH domain-containing protein [Cephalotus follicularis]
MERTKSPPSDPNSTTTEPPNTSPPPFDRNQDFAANFTSMYHSIFPPKSPPLTSHTPSTSPSSSSSPSSYRDCIVSSTSHRLNQARLALEYHQPCNHHDLCLSRLRNLTEELQFLRQENADLRLANSELVELLRLSPAAYNWFNRNGGCDVSDFSPRSVIEKNRFERRDNSEQNTLPKSISVRSRGYRKENHTGAGGPSRTPSRQPVPSSIISESRRVYVPAGAGKREEDEEMELDVYNQGMCKTELCNKWQEIGTCPYGDHCQFAHGINELRPIIRHPRYKTQVCRMILAGTTCPYGHRCHFRHSLTNQERMLVGQ